MKIHKGSCLCQKVSFEVEGDFESFFLCHCQHCQKDSGSAYGANLFSTTALLKWIKGSEFVKNYNLSDSRHVNSFCSECGSSLPHQENLLKVPAGSLDTKVTIKPTAHIFCASKASWENDLDQVKCFEQFPG